MSDSQDTTDWDYYLAHDSLKRAIVRGVGDAQKRAITVLMGELTYDEAPRPSQRALELLFELAQELNYPIPEEIQERMKSGETWNEEGK